MRTGATVCIDGGSLGRTGPDGRSGGEQPNAKIVIHAARIVIASGLTCWLLPRSACYAAWKADLRLFELPMQLADFSVMGAVCHPASRTNRDTVGYDDSLLGCPNKVVIAAVNRARSIYRSRKVRAICSRSGLSRYCSGVRAWVWMKISAGMPGRRRNCSSRSSSAFGSDTRTR